ncbi:MAG: hypothetical protein Q8K13_16370 [Parvibaculum sp.]|uniref:hypothetical protein n=1 Tax=Parvibaculum sp. TaxID=2024848 RepID=UPI00272F0A56|nr:hypothetical protein [Parvibaculum sp.]MDP2151210.1 hypothetical protein [Parvibaculum sp.]
MSACELGTECIFFNDRMAKMPSMAEMYKKRYCLGDFDSCARFAVFKAINRDAVPQDLYPNEVEKAVELIQASKEG